MLMQLSYRKSLNTSRALNSQASNTSRESDLIVLLIEAEPQIQAGFRKFAQLVRLFSKRLCIVY